jgi:imidazoleglycerol-phosphate dehydratase
MSQPAPRRATVERVTRETQIRVDLEVEATGDLHIDAHHTIEDLALTLGRALNQALGDKAGIQRMGDALVPLDEALAQVAIDLSGRPYTVFEAQFDGPAVGGWPVDLIEHFFVSFATEGRLNLHVRLLAGRNDHHRLEAIFKAMARALAMATARDPRAAGLLPSTKGVIE